MTAPRPATDHDTLDGPLSIDRLDVIAPGAFAAAVAPLFEGARMFLGRLAMARPFGSVEALFAGAREIAHAMPLDEKIELIDAHPRLGAPPAEVSALSYVEQGHGRSGTERAPEAAAAEAARNEAEAERNKMIIFMPELWRGKRHYSYCKQQKYKG